MALSRMSRLEDKKQQKRLIAAIVGSMAILLLVALFGVKALISFSLLVDKVRGNSPQTPQSQQTIIAPPVLDAPPIATNSATMTLTGKGQSGLTLIVYLSDGEFKKMPVPQDGNFFIVGIPLKEGTNTMSAKLTDDKGNTSDLSNVVSVTYGNKPPKLDVSAPDENANVSGDTNTIAVSGATDDEVTVTINDRLVVVRSDNTFTYSYPLNEGDNILKIVATDVAGNQTKVERKVVYHK